METVHTTRVDSPIGTLRVASTAAGLCFVELPHHSGRGLGGWLAQRAPGARLEEGFAPNRMAVKQLIEYLEGKRKRFEVPLDLRGTAFQLEVWSALREIPFGDKITYADLAQRVGRPKAVRAVGAANGANPVSLIVPCHRVVNTGGKLGGYAGGLDVKAKLLALEHAQPRQGDLL
ncbi:MAG: methylated-DNA--[protein]-cysteine S-methyltransferase [Myxococcota bacterium]